MKSWEHMVTGSFERLQDELEAKGWELVSAVAVPRITVGGISGSDMLFYLKRERQKEGARS